MRSFLDEIEPRGLVTEEDIRERTDSRIVVERSERNAMLCSRDGPERRRCRALVEAAATHGIHLKLALAVPAPPA
jgi:hypothetical protein